MPNYTLDPEKLKKRYIQPTPFGVKDYLDLGAKIGEEEALRANIHGSKYRIGINDSVIDGDSILTPLGSARFVGFDTPESAQTAKNEKAKKLEDLGISLDKQKQQGLASKHVFQEYMKDKAGTVVEKVGTDVFGRPLLKDPALTEHMVKSGAAVPTDRYDTKMQNVYRATQEKIKQFDPKRAEAMEIQREYNIGRQKPGFFERVGNTINALQSGTQQMLAGTADSILDMVTPGGNNTLLDKAKSAEYANQVWGYDPRESDFTKQEALHKFKNKEYVGAVMEMVKTPELWGESLPMQAELMFGVGKFTALSKGIKAATAGLEGAEKAAKIKDLKDKASMYSKVKQLAAENVGYLGAIADQTNRHIEAFTENNNGVPPDYAQIAEMTAMNALQLGVDRVAFKGAYGLKGGVSKFRDNLKPLVDAVGTDKIPALAKTIATSATAIGTAMGTEAAQEYVQTWAELMNERAGTSKYGNWLSVLHNQDSQDEAIIGALAGAGMGAQMRGVTEVAKALSPDSRKAMIDAIRSKQAAEPLAVDSKEVQPEVKPVKVAKTIDESIAQNEEEYKTTMEMLQAVGTPQEKLDQIEAQFAFQRKKLADVKAAINSKEVLAQFKAEAVNTEDTERREYLNLVLGEVEKRTSKSRTVPAALDALDTDGVGLRNNYQNAINTLANLKDEGLGNKVSIENSLALLHANKVVNDSHELTGIPKPASANYNNKIEQIETNVRNMMRGILKENGWNTLQSEEERMELLGSVVDAWTSSKGIDNPQYREALLVPLTTLLQEEALGSGPITSLKINRAESSKIPEGGLKLNKQLDNTQTVGITPLKVKPFNTVTDQEAKAVHTPKQMKENVKVAVQAKVQEPFNVEDISTETHSGLSARSIQKLADTVKLPVKQVKAALDIAAEKMLIKRMGSVSKEANETQYNLYFGEDGILPNYMKYKRALQDGNVDIATDLWNSIQKRYIDQAYKAEVARRSMAGISKKVAEMYKNGKSIDEIRNELKDTSIGVQGAKGGDIVGHLGIDDVIKFTDSIPQEERDKLKFSDSGHIVEAEMESEAHLIGMAARERLELPAITIKEAKRIDLYNSIVAKIAEIKNQIETLSKAKGDLFKEMTEEELVEYSEIDKKVKKLQDTLSSRVKDLEKQANYIKSNRIQYTNLTVGKDVKLTDKVGQKVGTVTQEEANELGIDENLIEEFVPQKTENEYKKLLEELKELKIERAKLQVAAKETADVVKEHKKNITALNKELTKAEEVLGKDTIAPVKQAVKTAQKADKTVQYLTDRLRKMKSAKKDLEAALKFLDKNSELFEGITIHVKDLIEAQQAFDKWLTEEGKGSTKEQQNAKIIELSRMSSTLLTIMRKAMHIAKASVVFTRRLMGMTVRDSDKELGAIIRSNLRELPAEIAKTEAALADAKTQRTANVKEAIARIIQMREEMKTKDKVDTTVVPKAELSNVLKSVSTLRKLINRKDRMKDATKAEVLRINELIRSKEAELKGTRLFKATVENNMLFKNTLVTNEGESLLVAQGKANPLVLDDLTKSRGSILANLSLSTIATMFDKDSEEYAYINSIINDTMKNVNKALFTNVIFTKEKLGEVLAANPAIMLLADVVKVDKGWQFNYKPEMMQALRLVTKNYLVVNSSKLKYNDDLAISKIIGVSEYDWRAIKKARPALKEQGQLLTIVASRIGDDFMQAMGISEGKIGEELYRKLVADIGNTGLRIAQAAKEVQINPMDGNDWNKIAVKKVDNKAKVVFVKTGETEHDKNAAISMETLKNIDRMLNVLNQQSGYRTQPIYAVYNKKDNYKIDGGISDVPEKSKEVLRVLEDQEYVINVPALTAVIDDYKKDPTKFLERSGWVDPNSILLKDARDAQESKNRELEDTMEKLVEMLEAYNRGELSEGVFFNWFFSSNGRYMIDAVGINPQADKHITRWLLLPKEAANTTWNLTNKFAQILMYDGIAQAFGFDIDKAKPEETKAFAEKLIVAYKLHKDVFEEMVRTGKQLFKEDKEGNFIPATKEELADKNLKLANIKMPHVGHAYMALEFLNKKLIAEKKGSKVFNATLAAEYDAKTSGPMHKLMQWPVLVDEDGYDIVEEWLSKGAIMIEGKEFIGGSSASHSQAITDGYQTVTIGAGKVLDIMEPMRKMVDKDGEVTVVADYSKQYNVLRPLLPTLVEITEEIEKATKEGRTLGKEAFVPFGYGSSTATVKENIGVKLAYAVLNRVVDPNDTEMKEAFKAGFDMTEDEYKDLQDALREYNTETIIIEMENVGKDGAKKEMALIEALVEMFNLTYGEAYKQVMEAKFNKHTEINTAIRDVTSAMSRVWKMKYDKEIAKITNPTTEQKMEVIKKLEQYFPLIKAPWSESRADGVAIFNTKRSPMKNEMLPTVQTATRKENGDLTSNPVQAMITEMEEVFAAGAVLPIHWIDGSQIGTILKDGGVQGIHDAIVLGIPTEKGIGKIWQMNKAMYDINANYNLLEEFQNAFLGMVKGMTGKDIEEFMMTDKAMDLAKVKDTLDTLVKKVNAAREKLYSKEMTVGNIIAFEGTAYNTVEDMEKYKALDKVIAELIKGCK